DAGGRVVERDRITHHHDLGLRGAARQRCGDQIGRGHHPVGVLVMLVDAEAVETDALGIFELVEILVIGLMADLRIEEARGHIDPNRAVILLEVLRQLRIGHQVEPMELHGLVSPLPPCCGASWHHCRSGKSLPREGFRPPGPGTMLGAGGEAIWPSLNPSRNRKPSPKARARRWSASMPRPANTVFG